MPPVLHLGAGTRTAPSVKDGHPTLVYVAQDDICGPFITACQGAHQRSWFHTRYVHLLLGTSRTKGAMT